MTLRAVAVIALLALVGCRASCGGGCTTIVANVMIQIVSDNGSAVTGARVTTTKVTTGARVALFMTQNEVGPGRYVVFDDNARRMIVGNSEPFLVTVEHAGKTVTQEYSFGPDACGCHVQRLAGPDPLVLSE